MVSLRGFAGQRSGCPHSSFQGSWIPRGLKQVGWGCWGGLLAPFHRGALLGSRSLVAVCLPISCKMGSILSGLYLGVTKQSPSLYLKSLKGVRGENKPGWPREGVAGAYAQMGHPFLCPRNIHSHALALRPRAGGMGEFGLSKPDLASAISLSPEQGQEPYPRMPGGGGGGAGQEGKKTPWEATGYF